MSYINWLLVAIVLSWSFLTIAEFCFDRSVSKLFLTAYCKITGRCFTSIGFVPPYSCHPFPGDTKIYPMFEISNPIECVDFTHLVHHTVCIDGSLYKILAVHRFTHCPPWRKGEQIGLLVRGIYDY